MRAAYYEGTALTGKGQNIGLLEFAGFDIADVNTYYKNAEQKRTAKVKGISTDGTSINCLADRKTVTIRNRPSTSLRHWVWRPAVSTVYVYVGIPATPPC